MLDNKGLTVKELWQKIEDLGGQWTTKDTKSVLSHKLQTLQTPMLNLSSNQPSDLLETDEGSSSSPSNSAPTRNDWILCESDLEAVHLFCAPDSVNKETKEVAELCKTRLQEGTCLVPLKAITMKGMVLAALYSADQPFSSFAAPNGTAQPFKSSSRMWPAA